MQDTNRRAFICMLGASVFGTFSLGGNVTQALACSFLSKHMIGDTHVGVRVYKNGNGPTYVNLHENESTSVSAARRVVFKSGGTLVQLQHSGRRNISFMYGGIRYAFDPNRMFTDVGIARNLRANGRYSRNAHNQVREFAFFVLEHLRPGTAPLVALHNNSGGNYSARSYESGGPYAHDVAGVYINPKTDPDNFFLVTGWNLYRMLKKKNVNVVLQKRNGARDDGSLSVYCGKHGIAYVNVEAQHGHASVQHEMLEILKDLI